MYPLDVRRAALTLLADGHSFAHASRVTGVSRAALRDWALHPEPGVPDRARCWRCGPSPTDPPDRNAYLYVLGLYLGDGHLARMKRCWLLRITLDDRYPRIQEAAHQAIGAVLPNRVGRVQAAGCSVITCSSTHWPCVVPQHGVGMKHDRPILLEAWQWELMRSDPRPLIRGLIHSDGCRVTNNVRGANGQAYAYPRYFFSNRSADIRQIFCDALDVLGIRWRQNNACNINVARRADVAALDEFVGPKS